MKRMKRRIISIVMAAVLLLGTGAIPVSATEGTVSGNSIQTENQLETETNTGGETSVCEECKQENGAHGVTCSKYVAECTCSAEGDVHAEECPLYEEPAGDQSTGTQPEAGCTCTDKCTETVVNADCALCSLEGADLSACAGENVSAVKTITGWSWIEAEGFEDMIDSENILPLVGVNERNPVALETLLSVLPAEITAVIEDDETTEETAEETTDKPANEITEETIVLAGWTCVDFPAEGAGSGSYVFIASLPEGYALAEDAPALTVTVELGGAAVYADVTHNGLTISGGTEGTDFAFNQEVLCRDGDMSSNNNSNKQGIKILSSQALTLSGTLGEAGKDFTGIYIPSGVTAYLTLDGATINGGNHTAPITVEGTLKLTLTGSNTITPYVVNAISTPGIWVLEDGNLVITEESAGSLTIKADYGNAAIGQSSYATSAGFGDGTKYSGANKAGSITINGGTLNLTSEGSNASVPRAYYSGAAIGSAQGGDFTSIIINGGIINAESYSGAAIGAGWKDPVSATPTGSVTINGGTINATGGQFAYHSTNYTSDGVGGSTEATTGGVTITGGSVKNTVSYNRPTKEGLSLYLTKVTLSGAAAGDTVTSITYFTSNGKQEYGGSIPITESNPTLYLWLPEGAVVTQATVGSTNYYGLVQTTADDATSGTFTAGTAGKSLAVGTMEGITSAELSKTGNIAAGDKVLLYAAAETGRTISGLSIYADSEPPDAPTAISGDFTKLAQNLYQITIPDDMADSAKVYIVAGEPAATGDFVVSDAEGCQYEYADGVLTFSGSGSATVTMKDGVTETTDHIVFENGAAVELTLKDMVVTYNGTVEDKSTAADEPFINVSDTAGNCKLILEGRNTITSAANNTVIRKVDGGNTLTFDGDGSLTIKVTETPYNGTNFTENIPVIGGAYTGTDDVGAYMEKCSGLVFAGGEVTIDVDDFYYWNGISGSGNKGSANSGSEGITISGGKVYVSARAHGIGYYNSYVDEIDNGTKYKTYISGGTVTGISTYSRVHNMGGIASNSGIVVITGGSVQMDNIKGTDNSSYPTRLPVNGSDTTVYPLIIQLQDVTEATLVKALDVTLSGSDYDYGIEDMYTDESGYLYLWLPNGAKVSSVTTADNEVYNLSSGDGTAAQSTISNENYYMTDKDASSNSCTAWNSVSTYAPRAAATITCDNAEVAFGDTLSLTVTTDATDGTLSLYSPLNPSTPLLEKAVSSGTTTLTYDTDRLGLAPGENTCVLIYSGGSEYKDARADVTVTVNKINVTIAARAQTITYGTELENTDFTATGLLTGHNSSVILTPSTTNVTTSGTITPSGAKITNSSGNDVTDNYEITYEAGTLTITKAIPSITWPTIGEIVYGQTLKDATLTDGSAANPNNNSTAVAGTFAWKDKNTQPETTGNQTLVFTPEDTDNYEIVEKNVSVTVNAAAPKITITAPELQIAGQSVAVTVKVENPYDSTKTDVPVPTAVYKLGENGAETALTLTLGADGTYTGTVEIPADTAKDTILPITVTTAADGGKYTAGSANAQVKVTDKWPVSDKITLSVSGFAYGAKTDPAPTKTFTGTAVGTAAWEVTYSKDGGNNYQTLENLLNGATYLPAGDYKVKVYYEDDTQEGEKTADFKVSQKELTAVLEGVSSVTKVYDGNTAVTGINQPTVKLTGAVTGETPVLASGITYAYTDTSAGKNKTVQATGIALADSTTNTVNANYTLKNNTASATGAVIVPAAPAQNTGYTINYEKESITINSGYEVYTAESGGTKLTSGGSITGYISASDQNAQTLYIRLAETNTVPASGWTPITIPSRGAAPTGLTPTDETIKGKADGTISNVGTGMEYSTDGGKTWKTATGDQITGIAGGTTVQIRYTATASAFHSEAANVTIAAGPAITVKFANGTDSTSNTVAPSSGNYTMPNNQGSLSYTGKVTKPADMKDASGDYRFDGWYSDAACTKAWDFGKTFKDAGVNIDTTDAANPTVTIYAKWTKVQFAVDVVVKDKDGSEVSGADVKLVQGITELDSGTTNQSGAFTFTKHVPAGIYNIIASRPDPSDASVTQTKTDIIEIKEKDYHDELTMPPAGVNSHLEVGTGTLSSKTVVGGLDTEAEKMKEEDPTIKKVSVTMSVADKTEAQAEGAVQIKNLATGKTFNWLDIQVTAQIVRSTGNNGNEEIDKTTEIMWIIVPFDFTGKENVKVYRYHVDGTQGAAEEFTAGEGTDGKFKLDEDGGYIHIYGKKFSTYAIGYEVQGISGGGTGGQTSGGDSGGVSGGTSSESGSSGDTSTSPYQDGEYDFWMGVKAQIETAGSGSTLAVDAGKYTRMPIEVMNALRAKGNMSLNIKWNGGDDISIPGSLAPTPESDRIWYELSELAAVFPAKTVVTPSNNTEANTKEEVPASTSPDTGDTDAETKQPVDTDMVTEESSSESPAPDTQKEIIPDETIGEETGEEETKESCIWHWLTLILMVACIAFIVIGGKKPLKVALIALGVDAVLTVIVMIIGSCRLDIPFAIVTLLVAGAAIPVKNMISGKDEEEQ